MELISKILVINWYKLQKFVIIGTDLLAIQNNRSYMII